MGCHLGHDVIALLLPTLIGRLWDFGIQYNWIWNRNPFKVPMCSHNQTTAYRWRKTCPGSSKHATAHVIRDSNPYSRRHSLSELFIALPCPAAACLLYTKEKRCSVCSPQSGLRGYSSDRSAQSTTPSHSSVFRMHLSLLEQENWSSEQRWHKLPSQTNVALKQVLETTATNNNSSPPTDYEPPSNIIVPSSINKLKYKAKPYKETSITYSKKLKERKQNLMLKTLREST